MKRLQESQNDPGTLLMRAGKFLLVPVVVLLAIPLAILIALAIYLAAILQGIKVLAWAAMGKRPPQPLPGPHYLDQQALAKQLPTGHQKG